jgi:hypothetical protein
VSEADFVIAFPWLWGERRGRPRHVANGKLYCARKEACLGKLEAGTSFVLLSKKELEKLV